MDLSRFSSVIDFANLPNPEDTWDLREKIGEGTFGEVYRTVHKQAGHEIAVKVLDSLHEVIEEVEEEYKILRDLGTHPNLPAFHGLFLTQPEPSGKPQLWIAMELCRGGSVTDLVRAELQRGSHLPELLLAHILKEVLQALYHLHSNHVVHRDVKGHNILLTSDAKVKLIDFGVSGHLDSTLSRRHTSVGTPFWMAPEVIACEQQLDYTYDVRCDVWSLGVTAIELADGEPPFADLHPMRALFKIPRSPPPTLKQPSKWSEKFRDFISSCVVKDFEKRGFVKQLLNHPFIKQVSEHTNQVQQQLERVVNDSGHMIQEPYITPKKDQQSVSEENGETNQGMEDLARLETLDEESIVTCLDERYHDNQIYTYMGDILLAVNPFTALPIYTQQWSSRYIDAVKGDHPPHIYAVADHAYQEMMHHQHNQCVVISGESGAGKTESANFLVQQLTMLGKAPNRNLEERILLVNPLVEAFGNAATVINDNSSRFGKYLEMSFTPSGKVTGASMTEYLLEKSRVVQQASGEQNFHVFYYIYHGLCQEDRMGKYHLQDQAVYRYLTNVDSDPKAVAAHRLKYKTVQKCFEIIGFKSQEVSSVYSILSAILHLGNVDFLEAESHHDTRTKVKINQLQHLAELLGIDTKELSDSLTSSGMVARGETIVKHYTVAEATTVRDAMAKALYGRLFSWIVNKINLLLKPARQQGYGEERNMVGILDIFGFENFTHNSFEQLCINIANEQIQSYFNQHIFLWEQREYASEGIDPVSVTFTDNQPVLELLLAKPLGLLALLDEESNFPKATDQSLVDKFAANLPGTHFNLIRSHDLGFSVHHYAGTVVYDSGGFLEKNRDRLALEVTSVLRTSQVALVRTLFNAKISKTGALRGNQSGGATGSLPKDTSTLPSWSIRSASNSSTLSQSRLQQTVASYFRFSLTDLLSKLVTGTPHFVRCIRPNTENSPSFFDRQKVLLQLRYTGVLETTRIRREGYPHRINYTEFVNRYSMMISSNDKSMSGNRELCVRILQKLGLRDYALGNTKVFLKYYEQEKLCRLYASYQRNVVCLQAWFRMRLQRRRYQKQITDRKAAAVGLQRAVRGWLCRKQYNLLQEARQRAAVTIQTGIRGFMVRREYHPIIEARRAATVTIQAATRGHIQRRRYHHLKKVRECSATNIQAAVRGYLCRRELQEEKETSTKKKLHMDWAATVLQKNFRMWRAQADITKKQLQSKSEEQDRVHFNQQVDKISIKMFHNQVLSMDRSSSTESEDWSDERKEVMQRVQERKQVWGVQERDYYYGMQTATAGKSLWAQQRNDTKHQRLYDAHRSVNLAPVERSNGITGRIVKDTRQPNRALHNPVTEPNHQSQDRRGEGFNSQVTHHAKPRGLIIDNYGQRPAQPGGLVENSGYRSSQPMVGNYGQRPSQPSGLVVNLGQRPSQPSGVVVNLGQRPSQPSGVVVNSCAGPILSSDIIRNPVQRPIQPMVENCGHRPGQQNMCDKCRSKQKAGVSNGKSRPKSHRKVHSERPESNDQWTRPEVTSRVATTQKALIGDYGVSIQKASLVSRVAVDSQQQPKAPHGQVNIHSMFTRHAPMYTNNNNNRKKNQTAPQSSPLYSRGQNRLNLPDKGVAVSPTVNGNGYSNHHPHTRTPAVAKSRDKYEQSAAYTTTPTTQPPAHSTHSDNKSHNALLSTSPTVQASTPNKPSKIITTAKYFHKSHPSSTTKVTMNQDGTRQSVHTQPPVQRMFQSSPIYASPVPKPKKSNGSSEPNGHNMSSVSVPTSPTRSESNRFIHTVQRRQDQPLSNHPNGSKSAVSILNDGSVGLSSPLKDHDLKPPVPAKPKHLISGYNPTRLAQQPTITRPHHGDGHQLVAKNGKKITQLISDQPNDPSITERPVQSGYQQDGEENMLEEKHRQELEEIDDMFNSVIELYTDQSENSRFLEDDGPSQREELHRETKDLQQQMVQSLEVQKKGSLSSRYIQEEKRSQRMAMRVSQSTEEKKVPDKRVQDKGPTVVTTPGPRETPGPVQVDFRSVLKKRGAKEEVQRLRTHILVS